MMKPSSSLCRRLLRAPRPHGRRGFSLMEMLAVVAILGIIAVVGGSEISRAWKRQKLQSASTDIRVLFQRALPEMQRRGMPVFVQVGPLVTAGTAKYLPIYLIGDADQDGAVGAFCRNPPAGALGCPDLLIDQYNIVVTGASGTMGVSGVDQEFSLSMADTTQVESTFWSGSDTATKWTSWSVPLLLRCDFQGRAVDATGRQIAAPATLNLTHVDIVHGSLMPPTRYVIAINPVWSVRVTKQTSPTPNDPTTWVTQNG
jgi:prepilin-type N-terminal cleavage/methylation domain-containing protein